MPLTTAQAQVKLRELTATFDRSAKAATPFYPRICNVVPSTGYDEKIGWFGDMPSVREWLGDRVFNQLNAADITIVNKEWENSLLIKRTDIEDDRLGQYGPVLQKLAAEATYHPDSLVFDLLVQGESGKCFDGKPFFSPDHEFGESGPQSNDLTLEVADPTDVTVTEFKKAYHKARTQLLRYKNDKGQYYNRPTLGGAMDLVLFVPPELEVVATEAIASKLLGGGDTNIVLGQPKIVPINYLPTGVKFYLINLSDPIKPFIFQPRRALQRMLKGLNDREHRNVKFLTDARYNAGYAAWWNAVLMTFVNN